MMVYLGLDEQIELKNNALFDTLIEHLGHQLKVFWQGQDDGPEAMQLECSCGEFNVIIESEDKND
jgi:hypothetical protein